ncbi:MAG: OmpH family outer membrane protein [Synergistaceae bacterium]|nr:OmpH family outer membrane protein [Synergistaceae bacterium]
MLKKVILLCAAAFLVLNTMCGALYAASDKIGFIDTQRILVAHPRYAESQKYVDEFITKKSDEARAAAEKEPDQQKRMLIIDTARQESGVEEMRIMNPLTEEINKVIESAAKAKGVTVVVEKVYIFYGGVDLTDDVIKGVQAIK